MLSHFEVAKALTEEYQSNHIDQLQEAIKNHRNWNLNF